MKLDSYIKTVADHGTHRSVVLLSGRDIEIRRINHTLNKQVKDYVGNYQHKVAWFVVNDGIVLLVSGSRIVTDLLERFLANYLEASQEYSVLYSGVGVRVFNEVVKQELEGYVQSGRSYGASRP